MSAPKQMSPEQMSGAKRRLLEKYLRGEAAKSTWELPLEPRIAGSPAPLAPDQYLIWLSSQMTTEPAYNEPVTVHFRGPLDREAFERAFQEVVRRHKTLRTTFTSVEDEVVQTIHDYAPIQIPFLDLSNLAEGSRESEALREKEANRVAAADARRPFDLAAGPLFRARLVKMGPELHRLYLTLHHIIFDGGTVYHVLLPEISAIYKAFAAGDPTPIPQPLHQFADFAIRQKRMLKNDVVGRQTAYWRDQLSGELPALQLPGDRPRPAQRSFRGGMKTFSLSPQMTAALKAVSGAAAATPYMFLLTAFKTMLHRYSGQEDILVGAPTDARRRPEFLKTMGHCVNFMSLRTRPQSAMTFRDYLAQVKDVVLGALANNDVPLAQLLRSLPSKRESVGEPFFRAIFSMEPPSQDPIDPQWSLTHMDTVTGCAKLDLYLEMDDRPEGYVARFVYSTDIFEAATIYRMMGHWLTLLESAIANPSARLGDLTMLTDAEDCQLRVDWNNTAREIPDATVHQLIEQQVARTPNARAVEADGERLTYRQLNERANRLAHRLRREGIGAGSLVALCVERTVDLVIAPLAVWKTGAAYLPLDPGFPKDRLAYLMEDAQAPVLLTTRTLERRLPRAQRVIFCDQTDGAADNLSSSGAESLAYVRYTSGSTGRPKGVAIHHRALANLLLSMRSEPGFSPSDSLLAVTTFSFDIAELELFLPLISGGRLVIASRDDARDPQRLMDCLRESKCNVLQATPASWRGLLDESWSGVKNLRAFCGGEALSRDLADQLLPRVAELWNLYGPTETTVWSAVHRVTAGSGPVLIGHPIDNTDVYVLDKNGKLLPVGVAGELHIGGAGVACGYLRREELTAERFVEHPFVAGQKVYRTGDLARWNADGSLECLGRIDNQIKIRGFRIEPGEIEAALMDHEGVREAAVRVWPDASGNQSIAAYVVGHANPESLRSFLQQKLPEYMIPARLITLDALPLTPNGKVDRNALPEPSASATFAGTVAPRNELERKLVEIWESVLDVRPIGIENNFFDLGGHSFLVAKLLRKIDSEFGESLSMASVFEAPTISRLAEMIGDKSSKGRTQQVVTLQPAGTREPIFWIHGGPLFRPLSNHLGTNRPFLGVSFDAGEDVAGRTLPQLATGLVRTIRAAQPHGPYHLGGWCISGLLAYEAASQLIDAGEKVALVAMLDALNPTHYRGIPKYRVLASKAAYHLKRLLHRPIGEMFTYGAERSKSLATQVARSPAGDGHNLDPAAIAYDPRPISAPVLHIQPADRPQVRDLRVSWASFLSQGNLEIRDVPGDHVSILMEPHVGAIARCINRKLQDNVVEIRRAEAV